MLWAQQTQEQAWRTRVHSCTSHTEDTGGTFLTNSGGTLESECRHFRSDSAELWRHTYVDNAQIYKNTALRWFQSSPVTKSNIPKSQQDRAGGSDWTPQKKTKQLQLIQGSPAGVQSTRLQTFILAPSQLQNGPEFKLNMVKQHLDGIPHKNGKNNTFHGLAVEHFDKMLNCHLCFACSFSNYWVECRVCLDELCSIHKTALYLSCGFSCELFAF